MCGIAGTITKKGGFSISPMLSCMKHRGPDDEGVQELSADDFTVTLGQRRLSIIDLSPAGHQPMSTPDGRYSITYNGELYNFQEIKKKLCELGHSFRSKTDTEVILAAHAEWGDEGLRRFNGMFAYALWDAANRELKLIRDHAGQKPLYYATLSDGGIVFASEIKALFASGLVSASVNTRAIPEYLGSLRVHAPQTMFEEVFRLPAGHILRWQNGRVETREWWDPLRDTTPFHGTFADAADRFDSLFRNAVRRHMVADVPVGAFLSGGLDSSLIASHASDLSHTPLTTLTTGFSESDTRKERLGKNELDFARMMRDKLSGKLSYHELILDPSITDLLPTIIYHLDEPIADPAEINAFLICEHARRNGITVLLSGMGADEIFAGYNHHLLVWHARHLDLLGCHGKSLLIQSALTASRHLGNRWKPYARYLERKGRFLPLSQEDRTISLTSWLLEDEVRALLSAGLSAEGYLDSKLRHFQTHPHADLLNRVLYTDMKTFLSEHNLAYTDKMSMASSCEVRAPFLDREIVEFAFSLPPQYKIRGFSGKAVVKEAALRSLPTELVHQRKSGFAAPIRAWKKEIADLARQHLNPELPSMAYFDRQGVDALLTAHAHGKDVDYQVWSLITFAIWHEIFIEKKSFTR